ncbi:hypothetical protein NECAME_15782 [Necator americanus]|uniref:Uncharacterized protein n=1 Tax=Necator americanus TaxID=51031 RepID=W2SFX7_NECAM|nr:hypothetical protein NECAME_15782 [Necator americanus]ETN68529.1 hypothetical protein NECAME_15782 [Necator americanus]
MEECRYQASKDCTEFSRVLLDLNPEHTYNFLLAALQMGLIDVKHWFLLTNMELSSMNMELFRFNHARFVSPYPVDPTFLTENHHIFNFTQFQQHIRQKWNAKTSSSKNFKLLGEKEMSTFPKCFTISAPLQQFYTFPDVERSAGKELAVLLWGPQKPEAFWAFDKSHSLFT